ncbi:MAG: EcsC family protein [Actinobacteria bacterium]|nr:EcsC family protein [Actinomycetota bacterium]
MAEPDDKSLAKKLKEIVLDVDPEGVFKDARAAGLEVMKVEDFRGQAHNYWRIEDLMRQYTRRAARFSAASGATSGVGGVPTAVALGGIDVAHMAAQLYWLCQRLAILNGFDPRNPLQRERTEEIYLLALGFDTAARAALKQQLLHAASKAGKSGARSNYILKFILIVAEKLGAKITTKQAAKFIPLVGGAFGATLNYTFARGAANKMLDAFKNDYFRTWQAGSRGGG